METIEALQNGYRQFRSGSYRRDRALYEALGSGQSPKIMIIACADSRADPASIFSAAPGQLFIVRNVANLAPPYETRGTYHGVSAAVEFAVTGLCVRHIVVMAHGGCGGIKASLTAAESGPVGSFIGPWVSILDQARDAVLAEGHADPQRALEHRGVGVSLGNLMTFPFVAEAVAAGRLSLHGAWFAIATGELFWRNPATGVFEEVAT
ncbi:MAG: carbonic anhydrase [Pseudomonadota bacterium]